MFAISIIIFREILEIALIVGVVMAATKGFEKRKLLLSLGLGIGALGALIVALFTDTISSLVDGMGQEIFNASIMFIAVCMLCWTAIWMRKHGREMTQQLKAVSQEVVSGNKSIYALVAIIATSTFREGSEIVLFIYGMISSGNLTHFTISMGAIIGFFAGSLVGVMLYYGLLKAARKHLFAVTGWMLIILAAGMAAQGVGFLIAVDIVPSLLPEVWNTSNILDTASVAGKLMQTLIGYNARPSGMEVVVYFGILIFVGAIYMRMGNNHIKKKIATS